MKYVDWVSKTYANGSYPMVEAIVIANDFDNSFIEYFAKTAIRNYNKDYRNAQPDIWRNTKLIKYHFDGTQISFEQVFPTLEG